MRLVLIGGGDFGVVPDKPYNLASIDKTIFEMTGKAHPRILFLGFNERANYIFGAFKKNYIPLGAQCEYLKFTEFENKKTTEGKFKRADAIFIGGGNTADYISQIRTYGLDVYLKEAAERNVILAGLSAGAICYSNSGMCDLGEVNARNFTEIEGLGLIDIMFCPHFSNSNRKSEIREFLKGKNKVAICLDDGVCLVVSGENYEIVKCFGGTAEKCFYSGGEFNEKEIQVKGKINDLILPQ